MSYASTVRYLARALIAILLCQVDAETLLAGQRYAFLVGVREYDATQLNSLQFTENDVAGLSVALQKAGYAKGNIVLMTQTLGSVQARLAPFAKNIRKELDLLLREAQTGDCVLVGFSGHGVQFAGDEENYFCPADADLEDRATLIPLGDIYKRLQASTATVKVLLVDACRNDPLSRRGKSRRIVDLETVDKQQPREPPGGIAAFFSCSKGEQSFEDPELRHGIFFHFVIEGLSGKADLDTDSEISLAELEQYAHRQVQSYARLELGMPQTPERRGEARGLSTLASASRRPVLPLPIDLPSRKGEPLPPNRNQRLRYISSAPYPESTADLSQMVTTGVLLMNPKELGITIHYTLAGEAYSLRPDYAQTLTAGRDWLIEFNRGEGLGSKRYTLSRGTYAFTAGTSGLDLRQQKFSVTIDNSSSSAFSYVINNAKADVPKGGQKSHTSEYPFLVRFDRDGKLDAKKKVDQRELMLVAKKNLGLWDLYLLETGR